MDNRLRAVMGRQGGVVSAADARAVGVDQVELRRSVARRSLVRVRRGAYVDGAQWSVAQDEERYRLAAMAVARSRPGDILSHHAALALHGLPLWGHDPSRFDLLSPVRQVTSRSGLHLHPSTALVATPIDGVPAAPIAHSIVGTALTMGRDCAVVAGDAALRAGLVTVEELLTQVAVISPHQGRGRALAAVLAMDAKAESVGESRTRLVLLDLGLAHESQVVITDAFGGFLARVDFLVEGVVLEFDGRGKYQRTRDVEDGEARDPADVLWLEKRREDSIRRRGHPVERVVWDELRRPGLLGARLRAARPRSSLPATHPETFTGTVL